VILDDHRRARDCHVDVVESVSLLDQAAIEAVRQWRFMPEIEREAIPIVRR
jgi:outer membrane biosynthesis protein TonB